MRFGLIGVGAIGAIRANALRLSPVCSLTAVSDLNEARARAVAPEARIFVDANELIGSDLLDAVIISAPPTFHESLTLAALAAGKHVLVEKPMAATPAACRRMAAAAIAAGKLLSVGYNQRYFEAVKRLRDAVQEEEIGRLSHVRAYAGHVGLAEFKAPWMYDADVMGGGALMDNGTHILDMVRYVMGDATEVFGQATSRIWQLPVEDEAVTLLRRPDGATASIEASWGEWKGYRFHIEAYGDRGMARASYAPMQYLQIRLDHPGGPARPSEDSTQRRCCARNYAGGKAPWSNPLSKNSPISWGWLSMAPVGAGSRSPVTEFVRSKWLTRPTRAIARASE